MLIQLQPTSPGPDAMVGDLSTDTGPFCKFLTLPKGDGLPGSAIPAGRYEVTLEPSTKFQQMSLRDSWYLQYANKMPHINNIPNRSDILIHPGNLPSQTDGCILVGMSLLPGPVLGSSRIAFEDLWDKIVDAAANEGCWLEMLESS